MIDDYLFKKRKNKKTQGAGYNFCHDAKKARKSQCVVSSSTIINGFHAPFKHTFYVGEKYTSKDQFRKKTDIALDLLCRFNKWATNKIIAPSICLIDGFYTNEKSIKAVLSLKAFKGFIGRFNKGRNIIINATNIKLKDYINGLNINKDFKSYLVNEKEKLIHEVFIALNYGTGFKLIIILDDSSDIKSARPLITNLIDLSCEKIAEYYGLRWKEETYHQVIKDAFFARTHKFRKLKTLSRYIELINIAYGLCKQRSLVKHKGKLSVFAVKNELLQIAKTQFILNIKGRKIKKAKQNAILKKFMI